MTSGQCYEGNIFLVAPLSVSYYAATPRCSIFSAQYKTRAIRQHISHKKCLEICKKIKSIRSYPAAKGKERIFRKCPASQVKRRPSATGLLLRTHSAGPVSQTCLPTTSKARADYALKPSMTRLHNAELVNYECGHMNPLLCPHHHRQVILAVKT